ASSGTTEESSSWKLARLARRPCQRSTPIANATPIGTATRVVSAARRRLWNRAACSSGSCQTERAWSCQYQRSENPCQLERERPALKENSAATPTGSSDQARYSRVKASRKRGLRQGLASQGPSGAGSALGGRR